MSKTIVWAMALVPALAMPWTLGAAGNSTQAQDKLVRIPAQDRGDDDAQRAPKRFDADAWRERLAARDLEARERAFDELAGLARDDVDVRRAVKQWAKDDSAGELAWTSRLLLRELGRSTRAPRTPGAPGAPFAAPFHGGGFDDLQRQMEELHRQFGGMDSLFGDLQRQLEDLQRALPPGGPGLQSSHQSFSMRSGPDGVEVEVEEGEGDERHTKTYKAATMEELLEAHPELRGKIRIGDAGDDFFLGARPRMGAPAQPWWGTQPFARSARPLDPNEAIDETRLGIHYSAPSADEARALGLDEGQGLRTVDVVPGSLAERLGIRAGDVVVELNGQKLTGPESVKQVLESRKPADELSCTVIDAKGATRKLTYQPKPARSGGKPDAKQDEGPRF